MGEVTSMTKTQHKYSRDPLYDWLVYKIHSVFEFLHTEWGFERERPVNRMVQFTVAFAC
jgi:ribosome-associated toxin RatA of RatAB toxin-antitoxin module